MEEKPIEGEENQETPIDENNQMPKIVQHGEGSHVHIVQHNGEGDLFNDKQQAENYRLKIENKYLKKIAEEKEACYHNFKMEYDNVVKILKDEIAELKKFIEILEEEIAPLYKMEEE